ncbi:hypothetical protein F941_02180 [Acinetobacter bouvetii DSM 14964 = CIP 107468]|uniref:IclR-ED domain-containing protein n=1 Tax=Acinetobacter bouvetii DSM 14964 = CIP 107468 TaxID=1120925 RepID=N9DNU9_9GAMM|nr:IclR family transcriptional regulator C-terminal domain-containing protein [Acinetobacter bouvetii]ENV82380.1 hypothetical protein F941_02180 [Acinetobacter bouvetii DSM 14964 = CIP 107468]BCU64219.1 hypothetical protein ACBO_10100 [Acinetobacter bouvetii]
MPTSACGLAYLSNINADDFSRIAEREGFEKAKLLGANSPKNLGQLTQMAEASRERGYGLISDTYELGMTAMAKTIINPHTNKPFGTVSIAGPSFRLNEQRVQELASKLISTAQQLGEIIHLVQI